MLTDFVDIGGEILPGPAKSDMYRLQACQAASVGISRPICLRRLESYTGRLHESLMLTQSYCGGTGTDSTEPTNTVQVPITTGIVKDSGSEYTGFIGVISGYVYKTGKL